MKDTKHETQNTKQFVQNADVGKAAPVLQLRDLSAPAAREMRAVDVRLSKRALGWMVFGVALAVSTFGFGQTTMPAGHPPMGAAKGEMPAGHPPMGGIGGMEGMPGGAPAAKAVGKLSVTLVAGTANSFLGANEDVTVELFHRGIAVKKYELKADAAGKVVVGDLPVMPPVQALVSVKHAGLLQQVVSPELSPTAPEQAIEMKVFDTTEEKPAWGVTMEHVIVEWKPERDGVRVVEMIQANTPGDRAWLGDKDGEGRRTLVIPLPAGAESVELGGSFDAAATKLVDGKIVTGGALFPGRSEYRIGYTVLAKDGAVNLEIGSPAAVGHLMVVVPEDGAKVTAAGMNSGMVRDMGDHQVRMFAASDLELGKTVTLAISGIPVAAAEHDREQEDGTVSAKTTGFTAKNLALGGAFLMLLVAAGLMLMKKPVAKKA